jgi:hypothetical protein
MDFQQFFEMVIQLRPELTSQLKGATESEISEMEKLSDQKLPADYRTFLQTMGRRMQPLAILREGRPDLNANIQDILSAHRKAKNEARSGKPPWYFSGVEATEGMLLLALDLKGNDNGNFFMDTRKPGLPVVEVTDTLGTIDRYPTLWAAVFSSEFPAEVRRAIAKEAHNTGAKRRAT